MLNRSCGTGDLRPRELAHISNRHGGDPDEKAVGCCGFGAGEQRRAGPIRHRVRRQYDPHRSRPRHGVDPRHLRQHRPEESKTSQARPGCSPQAAACGGQAGPGARRGGGHADATHAGSGGHGPCSCHDGSSASEPVSCDRRACPGSGGSTAGAIASGFSSTRATCRDDGNGSRCFFRSPGRSAPAATRSPTSRSGHHRRSVACGASGRTAGSELSCRHLADGGEGRPDPD